MTNKIVLLIILKFVAFGALAQETYFLEGQSDGVRVVTDIKEHEGRVFLYNALICDGIYECSELIELAEDGSVKWRKDFPWLDASNTMLFSNDTIVLAGNENTESKSWYLHYMSMEGDSIATFEVDDNNDETVLMLVLGMAEFNDKYVLAGKAVDTSRTSILMSVNKDGSTDTVIVYERDFDSYAKLWSTGRPDLLGVAIHRSEFWADDYRSYRKYDKDWNQVWTHDTEGEPELFILSAAPLGENGLVYQHGGVLSQSNLSAVDGSGDFLWQTNIPDDNGSVLNARLSGIYKARDNGTFLYGWCKNGLIDSLGYNANEVPYLAKINEDGQYLWERTFFRRDSVWADRASPGTIHRMVELEDGSLVLGGFYDREGELMIVKLTSDGCLEPDCGLGQVVSTTAYLEEGPAFSVSPNPVSGDILTVDMTDDLRGRASVSILDIEGSVLTPAEVLTKDELDISNLQPGVYMVRVELSGAYPSYRKFVKL